jgi:hypothetical protein
MVYTVQQVISNAYYTSGIVGREFETVSGQQLSDGVNELNFVIDSTVSDKAMVPYYTFLDFTAIIGQESYFIPNLIEVETLTFLIDTIRYSMRPNGRITYFGDPRANQILSLPFNYHVERGLGGATIWMYFLPVSAFPMRIWGLFRQTEYNYNDDMSVTLDLFYIDYLRFRLAQRLCHVYGYSVSPGITENLIRLETSIEKRSGPMDLKLQVASTLDNYNNGVNYALANLGRGWTVA